MLVTHNIKMNLTEPAPMVIVPAVCGDEGCRVLQLRLVTGPEETPWEIPAGVDVAIRYRHSGGAGGMYGVDPDGSPCWSVEGNLLRLKLLKSVLSGTGTVLVQAVLTLEDATLTTFAVAVDVKPDIAQGMSM